MSMTFRKVMPGLAVVLVSVAILLISISNRAPVDCEIARFFYHPNDEFSFEKFLEKRFRVFGVIEPGGLFSDPQYSFAIYDPSKERSRYKGYQYLISRAGIPHSRMAISIRQEAWESGKKVACAEGFEVRARRSKHTPNSVSFVQE